MNDTFRTVELCAITGVTYRQIDYWDRNGIIKPSVAAGSGTGRERRYSLDDVLKLIVVKQLLDAGVNLATARRAVKALDHVDEFEPAYVVVGAEGGVSVAADELALIEDLRDTGAAACVLRLDAARNQRDEAISRLRAGRALAIAGRR